MSKPFNVCVVGYGLSAKVFHIPLIQALPSDFTLHSIVQRSPKPNDDASKDHPKAKLYRSVDEAYADPDINLMVITSIPETHFPMVKASLESGKHVVVEKPFVATAAEAQALIDVQKNSGKCLAVYQNRRWDSDYLTLKKLLADGVLGDVAEVQTHFDRHRPDLPAHSWKVEDAPGHGAIYELGTHLIDQMYASFGMPERVTGFMVNQRRGVKGVAADSFTVLLHYEGMLVTAKAGVVSAAEEQLRYWVRGTKGSFQKFHLDVQEDQLREGLRPGDKDFARDPESHFGTLTTIVDGKPKRQVYPTVEPATYVEYYRLVAKALRGEGDVPVKAEEARDVLTIIDVALKSSAEGKTISLA